MLFLLLFLGVICWLITLCLPLSLALLPSASCSDGIRNGNETGVDCGGPTCGSCTPGATCELPTDCDSGRCVGTTNTTTNVTVKACVAGKTLIYLSG
jgi:hypothetical protein